MRGRTRNGHDGATGYLNHAVRRLWTAFRKSGGDFRNGSEVDDFAGVVQNRALTLPPRQRWAFELLSAAPGLHPYPEIIAELRRRGMKLKERTLRRLVERALDKIEDAIREHRWGCGLAPATGASARERPPLEREVSAEAASLLCVLTLLREAVFFSDRA
jgi:hypothetical protein